MHVAESHLLDCKNTVKRPLYEMLRNDLYTGFIGVTR